MGRDDYNPKMDTGINGATGAKKPTGCTLSCMGCLGIIVVLVVAFFVYSATRDRSGDEARDQPVLAQIACENAVKNSLKAPSTAKFTGTQASATGSSYRVTGAVDAENSFGAALRNTFECSVTFSGDTATATVVRLG
jgi:hypothetical protein